MLYFLLYFESNVPRGTTDNLRMETYVKVA